MARTRPHPKAAAVALAVTLLFGGIGSVHAEHSVDSDFVTTGHTTFLEASTTFDECFAGIVGALMTRVMWFNGATLFNRMASSDNTWIYAMETLEGHQAETGVKPFDPTWSNVTLFETGNVWVFPDENEPEHDWEVHEYYSLRGTPASANVDPIDGDGGWNVGKQEKVYVYTAQVADHAITDLTIRRDYNFVMVVNTCQFLQHGSDVEHTDGNSDNPRYPTGQHDPNDVPPGEEPGQHDHGVFSVDIFVGGKPRAVPLPADPDQVDDPNAGEPDQGGASS